MGISSGDGDSNEGGDDSWGADCDDKEVSFSFHTPQQLTQARTDGTTHLSYKGPRGSLEEASVG